MSMLKAVKSHGRSGFYLAIVAPIVLGLLPTGDALAEVGHCTYRQYSPKLQKSYNVCQGPATAEQCDALDQRMKFAMDFQPGACPTANVVAICQVGDSYVYFSAGAPTELEKGCEMMGGTWRPDLVPR